MQKILLLTLFLFLSTYANETITLSTPKTNLIKDENITLNITPSNINPKDITWIVKPKNSLHVNNLTITPIEDTTITVRAKYKNKISNPIILHVKWIVNGHTLPPKPNEKINNSTLLGIDVNNNDVRDDVERWIYETYKDKHPIHIDIAMQAARAYKKVLMMPERALEIRKQVNSSLYCEFYYRSSARFFNEPILIRKGDMMRDYFIKNIYFNTKKRYKVYIDEYNKRLSGHVFGLPKMKDEKSYCDFNTSKYGND